MTVEVASEIGGGGRRRFNGNDLLEPLRERLGEEADAGIEVPRKSALPPCDHLFKQLGNEMAIYLEECACADVVAKRADGIFER